MKEIYASQVMALTLDQLEKQLTEEQKQIINDSDYTYEDFLKELRMLYIIFADKDDILIDINEILKNLKESGKMSIEKIFGISPK